MSSLSPTDASLPINKIPTNHSEASPQLTAIISEKKASLGRGEPTQGPHTESGLIDNQGSFSLAHCVQRALSQLENSLNHLFQASTCIRLAY